mmetsp:Transcript_52977/g.110478  ORF Transcript_52977/g.110478 Transcript_52977/m.110478 type:complete len:283 (+) Transcript_52977:1380-2228(+)
MPSVSSSGIARYRFTTSTSTGGTYSHGPTTVHRSPGVRATSPASVKGWVARRSRASSGPSTTTSSMRPPTSSSPGLRKKARSPRRRSSRPICGRPSSSHGFRTVQYWFRASVTMSSDAFTTSSCTSWMWVSQSSDVKSHSSPARRCRPSASTKVRRARRWMARRGVSTMGRTTSTRASCTPGRYAPAARISHSSPACRSRPAASRSACRARRRRAVPGRTMVARTVPRTRTSTRGVYVAGPVKSHSSPATLSSKSRMAERRRAAWEGTMVSGVGSWISSSPG